MTSPKPLVSIVLISFNGGPYIREQLESLIAQSYPNIEIIISDDSSTDGTWELLQDFVASNKIKAVRNSSDKGLVSNLENGLRHASGTFIAISDQDDIWHHDKIDIFVKKIGTASAVFCDSELIDEQGNSLGTTLLKRLFTRSITEHSGFMPLLITNFVSGHAVMFHRDLLDSLIPFFRTTMYDHQIGVLAAARYGLRFVDAPLVKHRQHHNNLTNRLFASKPEKQRRGERNRKQLETLGENIRLVVRALSDGEVSMRLRIQCAYLQRIAKSLPKENDRGYQWQLFFLLWPMRHKILHFSKSRIKTLRLAKLCKL